MAPKFIILIIMVTILIAVFGCNSAQVSAQESKIPNWIKDTAKWWSQDETSDSDFLNAMQFLIDNNIIHAGKSNSQIQDNGVSSTNDTLSEKFNDLQSRYSVLQTKYSMLLQQVRNLGDHSSNIENNATITAVAVRPVIQSDGFFETTRYQGTILKISVDVKDGSGLILVNTAIPTGVDFQTSAKTAVSVAHEYTKVDLAKKDVIFSISAGNNQELQAVDGGSAGGAMTVLLISDILGKQINSQVVMTGEILSDGTIGPIGAVNEKAEAAGQYGAKIFLLPQGQAVMPVQTCNQSRDGPIVYQTCSTQEKALSPMMETKYGMKVIEINNIESALKFFNSQ